MNNNKNTSDCSDFQKKLNEIKNRVKNVSNKQIQQQKNTKTLIINPQISGHNFITKSTPMQNENFSQNLNFNQTILRPEMSYLPKTVYNNNCSDNTEEDESLPLEETMNSENINKLHINLVKTNNLNVLNNRHANSFNFVNEGIRSINIQSDGEHLEKDVTFKDTKLKSQGPSLMNLNSNGISTKDSNDSPDSTLQRNNIACDENFNFNHYSVPIFSRTYQVQSMTPNSRGKKLNFNNCMMNTNHNTGNIHNYSNPSFNNVFTGGMANSISENNFQFSLPVSNQNFQNLRMMNSYNRPYFTENAFSYNQEIPDSLSNHKSNSEKKKSKKSRDEVDQILFNINLDNVIHARDKRTTIMIRHIPNKYTTQSLLEEIDSNFRGKYDFFYLPMDFDVRIFIIFRTNAI